MNPQIQQLLKLQILDEELDRIVTDLQTFPLEIQQKQGEILKIKARLEEQKKTALTLQVRKKELENEVISHEEKVRKNEKELNSVKSNDVYKGLLLEIENAKAQKQKTEDQILEIMIQLDEHAAAIQKAEKNCAADIEKTKQEIAQRENALAQLQSIVQDKKNQREEFVKTVDVKALNLYKSVAKHLGVSVVAHLQSDICSGCHTNLTQSMINEVRKNKELFTCENCSRIVYIPDPVETA